MNSEKEIYIVTGASSGIGEAIAKRLNSLGKVVIAIARNNEKLSLVRQACEYKDNFHIEVKDLSEDIEALPSFVNTLKEKYGKLTGLVYCAGIAELTPLRAIHYNQVQKMFDINYFAPIFLTKGVLDKRNNTGKNLSIISIASIEAQMFDSGMCTYCSSKSALIASMKCIAKEYKKQNIKVNTISPAYVNTPLLSNLALQKNIDKTSNDIIQPEEIARMVEFIINDTTFHMTGNDITIGLQTGV